MILLVSSGIALLVGALIINSTFQMLITQRRRNIGLLRAVGTSRTQVWMRYMSEALALGVVGTGLGIPFGMGMAAAAIAVMTQAPPSSLSAPWYLLAPLFGVCVLITVVAALAPITQVLSVTPLESLQPADILSSPKAAVRARGAVGGVLTLAGTGWLGYLVLTRVGDRRPEPGSLTLTYYSISAILTTLIGLMVLAELLIPPLIANVGRVFTHLGMAPRLAFNNSIRNPKRAAASVGGLVLALSLIITLITGLSVIKQAMVTSIDQENLADVTAQVDKMRVNKEGFHNVNPIQKPRNVSSPNSKHQASGGTQKNDADTPLSSFEASALQAVQDVPGISGVQAIKITEPALSHAPRLVLFGG